MATGYQQLAPTHYPIERIAVMGAGAVGCYYGFKGVTFVLRDLVDECVTVAKADDVTLPGDVDAAVRKIAETVAGQYSSTAQDLAHGKRSEIDHLNGFIVRCGEALGVATPANRLLKAIVKLIESKAADSSLPLENVA